MEDEHKCNGKIWDGWRHLRCQSKASITRDGKWYCKRHDPVAIKVKTDKRNAKWDAEFAESTEKQKRVSACVSAFDSAASRLGISAIDLAEALQDGGIAELVEELGNCREFIASECYHQATIDLLDAILAKIRKEKE